jgi:hypothetical protein
MFLHPEIKTWKKALYKALVAPQQRFALPAFCALSVRSSIWSGNAIQEMSILAAAIFLDIA